MPDPPDTGAHATPERSACLESTLKGAIAEAAITAAAVELGIFVLRPIVEGRRYDLVFDIDHRLYRVQCKWARRKGAVVQVHLVSRRHTPKGYVRSTYSRDEIDAVAAYCQELKRCFGYRSTWWRASRRSHYGWNPRSTTKKPR